MAMTVKLADCPGAINNCGAGWPVIVGGSTVEGRVHEREEEGREGGREGGREERREERASELIRQAVRLLTQYL